MYLSNESLKQELVSNGLIIDCKTIKISQNSNENPKIFIGTGSINVSLRLGITARLVLFFENKPEFTAFDQMVEDGKILSGEIYPNNHYFSFHAIDVDGREWINPSVQVDEKNYATYAVVSITCNWIRSTSAAPEKRDSIQMLFLDEIDFPLNVRTSIQTETFGKKMTHFFRGGSEGITRNTSIKYIKYDAPIPYYEIIVHPLVDTLPSNYAYKLIETIRFLTASSVSFSVCESIHAGTRMLEFAQTAPVKIGIFPPPLVARPQYSDQFYYLLDTYLNHAISDSSGEESSAITTKLYPLYNLKHVSLEAIALLVSVTVESLTQHQFKSLGKASPALQAEIDIVFSCIKELEISTRTQERATSVVGGIKNSRAVDKLYELEKEGKISTDEIKGWKKLRDTSAHGSLHVTPEKAQHLLDNVYTAATLLNKLVFLSIGYCGKYTDYSKKGWPVCDTCISVPQATLNEKSPTNMSPAA